MKGNARESLTQKFITKINTKAFLVATASEGITEKNVKWVTLSINRKNLCFYTVRRVLHEKEFNETVDI